jgi:predicted dehydrogenase|tara:strand:+ start:980 stop:1840 length:861 start_codon:yes stop_codon:yes gene_type:complete
MKIGIVGLGYWGKILLKNLVELGYKDIIICEKQVIDWSQIGGTKYKLVKSYKDMACDIVFVVTPPRTHYEVCKHFLSQGINVFCEKPLTLSEKSSSELYAEANKSGAKLFVDWIFMYNPCVQILKNIIKDRGKPKNIIANRLNYGPARQDVSARWDLASHDVSIATYLLEESPEEVSWVDFKRNSESSQNDSVVGIINYEKTNLQINASWEFGKKDRMYTLEFDDGFVYWDDNEKSVIDGFNKIPVPSSSPLHISIGEFIQGNFDNRQQKKVTLNTIRILENESKI